MRWLRKNTVKILVILIHSLVLARLLLGAYQVNLTAPFGFIVPVLKIAVPSVFIGIGFVGLIRDRKPAYLLVAFIGGVLLWQTYSYHPEGILDAIRLINDKLSSRRVLLYEDFKILIDNMTLIVVALSFITIYVYPWNLLIMDLSIVFFLWAVDSLHGPESILVPLVLLWGFLFVHDRMTARDSDFSDFRVNRIDKRSRLAQGLVLSLLIGTITINLVGQSKGPLYEEVWRRANDYLMQDDFMPGNYFMDAFTLSATGYKDSSTALGGDVALNNLIALRARGDVPVYLRGNTKRIYTGSLWERSDLIYRTNNSASELSTDAYKDAPILEYTVDPAGVDTSSLFVPSYPQSVTFEQRQRDSRIYYSIQDQTFMAGEAQSGEYRVRFYDQAYVEAIALEGIDDHISQEQEAYLQIPDTVTSRTVNLVNEIIAGKEDQAAKILALTTYLRDQYKYSLTPGNTPAGEDFVDYFLFEAKEGYCIYYASALTIMLRIAGIPARYAEGFKVSSEADGEGNRLVRNSDAHAWTEVLTDPRLDLWTIWDATGTPRDFDTLGGNIGSTPNPSTRPGPEVTKPVQTIPQDTLPDGTPVPTGNPTVQGGSFDFEVPAWLWGLVITVFSALGVLLLKHNRIKKLLREESAAPYLQYIIKLLTESGIDIQDSDTLLEVSKRIGDGKLEKHLKGFVNGYYRASYGGQPLKLDVTQRQDLLREVYRVHQINNSSWDHLLRKYFL